MKKVLSLVLVIAMVLSSMSFAFAGTFTDVTGDYEDAVSALSALGVINGYEDGTFRPTNTIKRSELAVLLVKALGYGDLVAGSTSSFADMKGHWADGYVAIASGTGLAVGYPDGTFQPEKTVTYDEALTMIVRALGYKDAALKGTWPTNFKVKAIDLGLTKDVVMASTGADRGGVAQIFYNALEVVLVEVDADNKVTNVKDADGDNVILLSKLATETAPFAVSEDHLDEDSSAFKGDKVDLRPYMYQTIVAYEIDDEVVYVNDVDSLTLVGEVDIDGTEITVTDAKDKEYDYEVEIDTPVFFNGEEADFEDVASFIDGEDITVVFNKDADAKYNANGIEVIGIIAKAATTTVQLSDEFDVEDEFVTLSVDAGEVFLPVTENDDDEEVVDYDNLIVSGDATSLEEIEEDDVLTLYAAGGVDVLSEAATTLEIVVARNVVEGKITRTTSDKVTVAGTAYKSIDGYDGVALTVGKEVKLFLDANDVIYTAEETGNAVADDYAVVIKTKNGVKVNGVVVADPKITLVNVSGEEVTYVLDDKQEAGSDLEVAADLTITFDDLTASKLVKYNVNKDGEVDKVEVVAGESITDANTKLKSFDLASNVVIFELIVEDDDVEANVIEKSDLGSEVTGYKVVSDGKIEVLVLTDIGVEEETTYAIITDNTALALNDDDDEVIEYTALVDGKEVVFLGEDDDVEANTNPDGTLVKLVIENGVLISATPVTTSEANDILVTTELTAANVRVNDYITDVDGETYYLEDNVVVYVVEADDDIVVGTKADIRGERFVAYNLDTEETVYSVVVVFEAE